MAVVGRETKEEAGLDIELQVRWLVSPHRSRLSKPSVVQTEWLDRPRDLIERGGRWTPVGSWAGQGALLAVQPRERCAAGYAPVLCNAAEEGQRRALRDETMDEVVDEILDKIVDKIVGIGGRSPLGSSGAEARGLTRGA